MAVEGHAADTNNFFGSTIRVGLKYELLITPGPVMLEDVSVQIPIPGMLLLLLYHERKSGAWSPQTSIQRWPELSAAGNMCDAKEGARFECL